MAERRMVARGVVSTDAFLDMPMSARLLYMYIELETDDEGFVASPRAVCRLVGAGPEDVDTLVRSGYLIRFDSGVVLVRHFFVNNAIRADRARPTRCAAERALVELDSDDCWQLAAECRDACGEETPSSGALPTNCQPTANQVTTNCQPSDNQVTTSAAHGCGEMSAQDKVREEKAREEKRGARTRARFVPPSVDEVREFAESSGIAVEPDRFVDFYASKGWMVGRTAMKDWRAAARNWARRNSAAAPSQQASQTSRAFTEYD